MNGKIVAYWLSIAIMIGYIVIIVDIATNVKATTIYVDDDYTVEDATHKQTIQAAVDVAQPGDTVYVYNGTYYDIVRVEKGLDIIGAGWHNTTIITSDMACGFLVSASHVNITGFTITNSGSPYNTDMGIYLNEVTNCSVTKCYLTDNKDYGIYIKGCSWINIENNLIELTERGIYFTNTAGQSNNATISNNTIYNIVGEEGTAGSTPEDAKEGVGIRLRDVFKINVFNNHIYDVTGGKGGDGGTGTEGAEGSAIQLINAHVINISSNYIHHIKGGDGGDSSGSYVSGKLGAFGAAISLTGSSKVHIEYNNMSDIYGGKGGNSGWLKDGRDGGPGVGVYFSSSHSNEMIHNNLSSINGGLGGNAYDLADGGDGGEGKGLYLLDSNNNQILSNNFKDIVGGEGGYDDKGRQNGWGGGAYGFDFRDSSYNILHMNLIENVSGHDGGSSSGFSGSGGYAAGINAYYSTNEDYANINNVFSSIKIVNITGGSGGQAGGFGSEAGDGGSAYGFNWNTMNGTIISDIIIKNIKAGDGGNGGPGGAGGTGGNGRFAYGIYMRNDFGKNNTLSDVIISNVTWGVKGIGTEDSSDGVDGEAYGIFNDGSDMSFTNGSINEISNHSIRMISGKTELINVSFNKSSTFLEGSSELYVKWFLHIHVVDSLLIPKAFANVRVKDNGLGGYDQNFSTGVDGSAKWIVCTEYLEDSSDRTYYTPHNITAILDPAFGYANPEPIVDVSKSITIIIDKINYSTFLEHGWNLISLSLIQINNNLGTILSSITGNYDIVQRYLTTDTNDSWKHNQTSKPLNLNDLKNLDHTTGFWIHITNPSGTDFVYYGIPPPVNQTIPLYPGWNMVGYPSLSNHNRTVGLNNLTFDDQVDAIWSYNATTQKWEEMGESDLFMIGRGYYIHAKTKCEWEVPL